MVQKEFNAVKNLIPSDLEATAYIEWRKNDIYFVSINPFCQFGEQGKFTIGARAIK